MCKCIASNTLMLHVSFILSLIDLVPVSSTVIPLYTHQLNSTDEYHPLSSLDEEYRIAYMKLLSHRKHTETDDPDTLITCNFRTLNIKHSPLMLFSGNSIMTINMLVVSIYSNEKVPSGQEE